MSDLDKILHVVGEGGFWANMYMLELPSSTVVIDPAQALFLHASLREHKRVQLFATHAPFDHVYAEDRWRNHYDCELAIHEAEQKLLCNSDLNASYMIGTPCNFKAAEKTFRDGEHIDLGDGYYFEIVHTPGHTKGSSCFLLKRADEKEPLLLFSGDTLFMGSIGRSDLPTGPVTDFARERVCNPWLR